MLDTSPNHVPYLLQLPLELRDNILFCLFFSKLNLHTSRDHIRPWLLTAYPNRNLLKGYEDLELVEPAGQPPTFDVSVLRTCKQLKHEGEDILYRNVHYDIRPPTNHQHYEERELFLEKVGDSQLSRIRFLTINEVGIMSAEPMCGLKHVTWLIENRCTALQKLLVETSICNTPDDAEYKDWGMLTLDHEWAHMLWQLRRSLNPDILCIPSFDNAVVPEGWIKSQLSQFTIKAPLTMIPHFPVMKLPSHIRKSIICYAVLPPTKVIHPCLPPAVDGATLNLLPLFLTCQALYQEAEQIVYEEAIFSNCKEKAENKFKSFLRARSPRQKTLMKRFFSLNLDHWVDRSFDKFLRASFPNLVDLEPGWRRGRFHPCFRTAICLTSQKNSSEEWNEETQGHQLVSFV